MSVLVLYTCCFINFSKVFAVVRRGIRIEEVYKLSTFHVLQALAKVPKQILEAKV